MATLFMRFPGGRKKALTLSYDDGVKQDAHLIGIMKEHGLKGTFNLNSELFGITERRVPEQQIMEMYTDSGMEIAAHGLTHLSLANLSQAQCCYEMVKDRENLENMFHTFVRGMAYANGSYDDEAVEALKAAGIVYARTARSTGEFTIPQDWMRLVPTCRHREARLMELAHRFVEGAVTRECWLFYLWGHSYEFDDDDNWYVIEEFAEYMGNREEIWYATNLEIYEYIEAYEHLIYSVDGNRVKNPTVYDLYFERNGSIYCIRPGEVLTFTA